MKNASKQTSVNRALIGILILSVAGCGGGGGGGGGTSGRSTNAPPTFGTLSYSTKLNTDLQGQVTASDPTGDALSYAVSTNPASGTLVSFNPTGSFVYRPSAGFLVHGGAIDQHLAASGAAGLVYRQGGR